MSQLGQKSIVYHGDYCLGEVEIVTTSDQTFRFPNNEIRINHISQPSERCPPLSILQTISPFRVRCKLNPIPTSKHPYLITLYDSCLNELKTAVVIIGGEELHMVAMPSKQDKMPCFWCCSVPIGLYGSCLGMLNLRCLSIVFDLDETLIVANTMKSFEDKIEFLQKRLECEDDPLRVSGMSAELRRYVEDRALLKQYVENDNVVDNSGKLLRVQFEEVLQLSNEQERIVRPVIRLKERNTVLTRINPEIRDTSVLVRLRPAWEDLRSYLNAKGRKRFEVYVCTMAERDYALEMWRLLDPEAHLITSNQLLNRIVCVKSGGKKSLPSVFREGICHPKLAMVIDDRLKVWEDDDQPRVHVVPPFTPYYSPQAETANIVPVLCVARNVACNVRAGFFKEFDENLLRRIFEMCYEDEVATLPYSPDVSDFLMSEDTGLVVNGNRDAPIPDGMNGAEVEQRLHRLDETPVVELATSFDTKVPDLRPEVAQQPVSISPNFINSETSKTNLPLHKSGLPESRPGVIPPDLDTDKKRRFIDMHHGQDIHEQSSREPSLSRPTTDIPSPAIQTRGGWLVEEDSDLDQTNNQTAGPAQELDESQDKQQAHQNLPCFRTESIRDIASELKKEEAHCRQEGSKLTRSLSNQSVHSEGEVSVNQENKEVVMEAGKIAVLPPYLYIGVLQEIGRRCGSKIEFRSVVSTSKDLQFSVEVLFTGEKIGVGMGKTKKDAQQQAAEKALHMLADEYKAYSGSLDRDLRPSLTNDNGFLWDDAEPDELREALPNAHASEAGGGALGGLTSFGIHETRKRANSPRSSESIQNKRLKGDLAPGLQVATLHKNENTVS